MSQRLTVSQFAEKCGCDRKQVYRAIEYGTLSRGDDGLIDAKLAKTDWRKTDKRTLAKTASVTARTPRTRNAKSTETPEEAASRLASGHRQPYAASMAKKEHYQALLRQFEYDQKSGAVALIADVARALSAEYSTVRTRLLSIPAELAPRLHQAKSITEIQALLQDGIAEALEGLTGDKEITTH